MKRNLFWKFSKAIVRTLPAACVILSLGVTCFATTGNTNTAVITLGNGSGVPGGSVVIPVSLATTGSDLGPTTFGFDLLYDSTKFDTQTVALGPAAVAAGVSSIFSYPSAGAIRISGYGLIVIADGVIVNVTFKIKSDATPGVYPLIDGGTLEVLDTNAEPLSASVVHGSITVIGVLTITTTTLPASSVGNSYSQSVSAEGGAGAYHWSISAGSLPGGLAINPSTGVISGTPTTATGSPFNFTVRVADSQGTPFTDTQALSIVINPALTITTTSLPNGRVGTAYSQSVVRTGGVAPYAWSISAGSLPDGLAIDAGTGAITGTPTTATGSPFNFTVRVADSQSTPAAAIKALSITVIADLNITTTTLPDGMVGAAYSQGVSATGGAGAYHWTISAGALPGGLTIGALTGTISGTVGSSVIPGTFNFTVRVADSQGTPFTDTQALSIIVSPAVLNITTTSLTAGTVNTVYNSQTVSAINGIPPYAWSISAGSLPGGLAINPSTGAITGTPTTTTGSPFNFTVMVTDNQSPTPATDTQELSITINSLPTFNPLTFFDKLGSEITGNVMVDTPIRANGEYAAGGDGSALAMSQWVVTKAETGFAGATREETFVDDTVFIGDTVFVDTTVSDSCWLPANMLKPDTNYILKGRAQNVNGAWSEWVALEFSTVSQSAVADANNDGVPDDQTPTDTDLRTYGFAAGSVLPDTALIVRFNDEPVLVESTDGDTIDYFAGITPSEAPPTGSAPVVFRTRVIVPVAGDTISLTYTFPAPLPSGTKWYKYDESAPTGSKWSEYPDALISGSTVTVTLQDGGKGDADGVANGIIIDPAGPVAPVSGDNRTGGDSGSLPVGPLAAGISALLVWWKHRKQR